MLTRDLLLALREGWPVPPEAVQAFGANLGAGEISDAQAGAFAMAICLQGLSEEGRVALTLGMRDSGKVLNWDLPGKVIDKHSTGGVGDSVSLILAPMLAAVGAYVPMISGRGLGHTGGTLDKLEAIPGLKTQFTEAEFRAIVAKVGCAIVAPSPDIAPADQRLYAVRDVTGTVRSRDLITASILAKKLAAGLEGLVLDVKTGSGAVMSDLGQARDLAQALVATANGAGCPTSAVLTDMSQPLIPSIGNALEIADVMRAFESGQGAMVEVALELGTQLLLQTQMFLTETGARDGLKATLQDGSAKARFGAMVRAQGGPENFADRWQDYLEIAPAYELRSPGIGYLTEMDGAALGQAVVALGGGRQREDDRIDHSVGLSDIAPLGTHLRKGALIARLHCRSPKQAEMAMRAVQGAVTLSAEPPVLPALIIERITPTKVSKHG
ncbi:MAG: thymidine phosphorylase [Planktomarina temperata]|jgi:thymidine phosphorylase|nr:thymidine phosphorylase [Planktomarina temperata]